MESFSVSQFVDFLNAALTTAVFPEGVAVEGEVTGYRVSQGKWIWFNLKDESAVVSCFATTWGLRQPLEDGLRIRAYGRPKVHGRSGRFSLNVERAEAVGAGGLKRAFELLRAKLEAEGLFAPERKRPLPEYPSRIGLITSAESAAYGDFIRILGNRWGGVEIRLADVPVQGQEAPAGIAAALTRFQEPDQSDLDLLVLIRGGGSLEDLQAFNDEDVCRAVFASRIPIVVGVGHERDVSLADLAADVRASTPSNAAEIVFPDRREVGEGIESAVFRIQASLDNRLAKRRQAVSRSVIQLEDGLRGPLDRVERAANGLRHGLAELAGRTAAQRVAVSQTASRLGRAAETAVARLRSALQSRQRILAGLDPKRLLDRGYAIVRRAGRTVKAVRQVRVGETVSIQLAHGGLTAEVTSKSS